MHELFPLTSGLIIGGLVQLIRDRRQRVIALVALCIIFGALASFVSGELEVSWGFLTIDAALVWLGAVLGKALHPLPAGRGLIPILVVLQ